MGKEATLAFTPTWVVAIVCLVIVSISLAAERSLHYLGKVRGLSMQMWRFCGSSSENPANVLI
jgi:hypothetical protein